MVPKTNSDRSYVKALKNGDKLAFEKLYLKYSKKVFVLSTKFYLSKEEAEEIVQDVFLKIWNHRENLNEALSFNAYIFAVAKSMILKVLRKKGYQKSYQQYVLQASKGGTGSITEDEVIFSDFREHLIAYIRKLPPKQKKIFLLKSFHDLSASEISEKLNLSKRTVENQIYRASKSVKQDLSKIDVI